MKYDSDLQSYVQAIVLSKCHRSPHAPEATDDPTPLLGLDVPWEASGLMVLAGLKGHLDLAERPLPCTSRGRFPHCKEQGLLQITEPQKCWGRCVCNWKCCRSRYIAVAPGKFGNDFEPIFFAQDCNLHVVPPKSSCSGIQDWQRVAYLQKGSSTRLEMGSVVEYPNLSDRNKTVKSYA